MDKLTGTDRQTNGQDLPHVEGAHSLIWTSHSSLQTFQREGFNKNTLKVMEFYILGRRGSTRFP